MFASLTGIGRSNFVLLEFVYTIKPFLFKGKMLLKRKKMFRRTFRYQKRVDVNFPKKMNQKGEMAKRCAMNGKMRAQKLTIFFYNSSPAASGARPVELVEADFFMTLALNDSGGCRLGTSVE